MRFCIILLVLFGLFQKSVAQTGMRQAIFMEMKGAGVNLTLNYDTRFSKKVNGIGGRIGFGYFGDRFQNAINIPLEINYLAGKRNHFLEIGTGMVWGSYKENSDDQKGFADIYITPLQGWAFCLQAGYRYQQPGHILFRANFTPLFTRNKIYPLAGISRGYAF